MILTRHFAYIHPRKTGGTFVSTVLGRIYRRRGFAGRMRKKIWGKDFFNLNQHGTCSEIPASHRHLPIVSTVRNPYDRYVSMYRFDGWKRNPDQWFADHDLIRRRYPHSPDLSFAEFVEVASSTFKALPDPRPPEEQLGALSEEFVRYYLHEPEKIYPEIDDAYIAERRWEGDMYPVRFLHMENLNQELYDCLLQFGCKPERISFVLEEGRIRPAQSRAYTAESLHRLYTAELRKLVRHRERLLFAVFPEYDES